MTTDDNDGYDDCGGCGGSMTGDERYACERCGAVMHESCHGKSDGLCEDCEALEIEQEDDE